jgi:hypothetical protein
MSGSNRFGFCLLRVEEVEDEVAVSVSALSGSGSRILDVILVCISGVGDGFFFVIGDGLALGLVLVCNGGFYAMFWWPCSLGGDGVVGCSSNGYDGDLLLRRQYWWFLVIGVLFAVVCDWFSEYFDFIIISKYVEICINLCPWLTSIASVVTGFPWVCQFLPHGVVTEF